MAGLQRSTTSFRRQGSSGLVWDGKLLSGELTQLKDQKEANHHNQQQGEKSVTDDDTIKPPSRPGDLTINTMERSRSNGGRGYRTGRVSPALEPPSPKLSACGFCSGFSKQQDGKNHRKKATGKRRSR